LDGRERDGKWDGKRWIGENHANMRNSSSSRPSTFGANQMDGSCDVDCRRSTHLRHYHRILDVLPRGAGILVLVRVTKFNQRPEPTTDEMRPEDEGIQLYSVVALGSGNFWDRVRATGLKLR
jgi:hypothetical protein